MPRSLVVGNGSLLATFDERLQMRDIYFPYVGMEDHTQFGHVHRTGMYVEGRGLAWFSDPSWQIEPAYREDTPVGNSHIRNEKLGVKAVVQDYVHPIYNILVRELVLQPIGNEPVTVKCFFHHDFHIYGDKQKDTAFYEPYTNSVIHYRAQRYFLVGGRTTNPVECITGIHGGLHDSILPKMHRVESCGLSSFTVGKGGYRELEGTWRDAEDGQLSRNAVEQGSVDSTVCIEAQLEPGEKTYVTLWLCAATSLNEALDLNQTVLKETPERLERNCHNYWKSWVNKTEYEHGSLSASQMSLFKRSLLLIRLHCDNHGGILAAADADIMLFNKDTYTYVWPRDGAFVALALDKAGYTEVTRRFFEFCSRVQMPDGYMLHKYNPDGSLGSSWHPWYKDGEAQLPIQEDETALVLYALHHHFLQAHDFEFLQQMYERFVKKAAQFLVDYREEATGLPLPSYDPWEEHRGISTYTTACTIAGLEAAANIAQILGHYSHCERYQTAADEMRQAMFFHLFDESTQRFVKKIDRRAGRTTNRDLTPDMSIAAIWKLGVLRADDPRVMSTMNQLEKILRVNSPTGGIARYQNDRYHADAPTSEAVTGNPWILTTLWLAQWHLARAKTKDDLKPIREVLDWCVKRASDTGILAEQYHPVTGRPLSVAPLTWSHATYVETILLFLEKEQQLST